MSYHLLDKNKISNTDNMDMWELTFFDDNQGQIIRVRIIDDKANPSRLIRQKDAVVALKQPEEMPDALQ